jgi:membrane protease YdiL (CAAX protease family)
MSTPLPGDPDLPDHAAEDVDDAALPGEAAAAAPTAGPRPLARWRAIGEVVLCSSYPTQIVAATALALAGVRAQDPAGGLDATFVIAMAALDAVLVVALIVWLLRRRGETLAALVIGRASPWREIVLGVALVVPVTLSVALVVTLVRLAWPALHNVPTNPMTALMANPRAALLFAITVVIAGGVREEVQRAFQLHRLTPGVMSRWPALVLTSLAFGLGHTVQGYDVAIATGGLGFLWGALWLLRGSAVAPAVCHALFNLGQVAAAWWVARAGLAV